MRLRFFLPAALVLAATTLIAHADTYQFAISGTGVVPVTLLFPFPLHHQKSLPTLSR